MKKHFLFLLILWGFNLAAQESISVYTKTGSMITGILESRDSVNQRVKIKIQGGSILAVPFRDIDSIASAVPEKKTFSGSPYYGFGLGIASNAIQNSLQVDAFAGYQFNTKFQAGFGLSYSHDLSTYLDIKYYPFQKKFFAIGAYANPGLVLTTNNYNPWYNYGYRNSINGFYSNTGFSFKLKGEKTRSFSVNAGYQFVSERFTYYDYQDHKVVSITNLNRYIIQGIFNF
jgi:hypothetical protein